MIDDTPMLVTWGQFHKSREVKDGQMLAKSWQSSSSTLQPPRTKVLRFSSLPLFSKADFKPFVDRLWQSTKLKNVRLSLHDFKAEPKDSVSMSRPQPPRYSASSPLKFPAREVIFVHPANLGVKS